MSSTCYAVIGKMKQQLSQQGVPDEVVSEWRVIPKRKKVKHVRPSPYHSQLNGKVESAVNIF